MSIPALNWALDATTKNAGQKVVLIVLANYADETNRAWPAQKTLARQSCMSDRNVRRALIELEELCFVTRTHRYTSEGQRTTDAYLLHLNTTGQNVRKPSLPDKIDTDYRTNCPTEPSVEPSDINNYYARAREEVSAKPVQEESPKPATPKPQPAKQQLPAPPAWLSEDAWQAFLDMRKSIKAPITPRAAQTAIKKLTEFHHDGYDANEVLDEIVLRCWRGIYLPDNLKKRNAQNFEGRGRHEDNRRNHKLSAAERAIEDEREFERRQQAEYCRVYDIAGQRIK